MPQQPPQKEQLQCAHVLIYACTECLSNFCTGEFTGRLYNPTTSPEGQVLRLLYGCSGTQALNLSAPLTGKITGVRMLLGNLPSRARCYSVATPSLGRLLHTPVISPIRGSRSACVSSVMPHGIMTSQCATGTDCPGYTSAYDLHP